ncbi:MAG: nucleotidyltransferase domain-containing protein [Thermoguttaceae bacterium]
MTRIVNRNLAEKIAVELNKKLNRHGDFIGLYLYGSCIRDSVTPESDIDIVAVFESPKDHDRGPLRDAWDLEIDNDVVIDFHAMSLSQLQQNGFFYDEIKKGVYYERRYSPETLVGKK